MCLAHLLALGFAPALRAQQPGLLDSLLSNGLQKYAQVLDHPDKYKLQILYTRIDRNKKNEPRLTDYAFHVHKDYVYPASTVKLPMALLALIKLRDLHRPGLDRTTTMITDSAFYCQKKIKSDSSSFSCYPSIGQYIKKMFLVSDNYSFARVYEFVGSNYAQEKLSAIGFDNIRLFNRLDGQCPGDTARITPPVYFLDAKNDTIYKQSLTGFTGNLRHPVPNSRIGDAHVNAAGKMTKGAKDFSNHNYFEAVDLHRLMKELVFNAQAPDKSKLPISDDDRLFMLKELGLYPRESDYPHYDKKIFYDSYKKYLLYGSAVATIRQDSIRVINIVGRAYGFLIDCAYIVDFRNKVEFFLTASMYVNESNKIGHGKYEYEQLGLPFMKDLGWCIYRYESGRNKRFPPDLGDLEALFEKK